MKPYVKQFENGVLVNPITKDKPYLHPVTVNMKKMLNFKNRFHIWRKIRNEFFIGRTPSFY